MSPRSTTGVEHSAPDILHRLFFYRLPIFVLGEIKFAAIPAQRKQSIVSLDDFIPWLASFEVAPKLLAIRVDKLFPAFDESHFPAQLCFRCDVSETGQLVSQDHLAKDLHGFIALAVV